ncbi:MAG: flippase, partial [Candidatus Altiarchaeota archaeon]
SKYFWSISTIKAFLCVFAYAVMIAIVNAGDYPRETVLAVYVMGLAVLVESFAELLRSVIRAFEEMEYVAYSKVVQGAVTVAVGLVALYYRLGLVWFSSAYFFGNLASLAYTSVIGFARFVEFRYDFDYELLKKAVKMALPLIFSGILGVTYYKVDILMLSYLKGDAAVGVYNAAFQIIGALLFVPTILSTVLLPVMSRFYETSRESLNKTFELGMRYLLILSLPMFLGLALLADRISLLVYGAEFAESAGPLAILSLSGLFLFMNYLLYNAINAINRQNVLPYIITVGLVVNIVLNAAFIPSYNFNGAAVATTISNGLVCAMYVAYLRRSKVPIGLRRTVKMLIPLLVMVAVVYAVKDIHVILTIACAAAAYFTAIIAVKTFTDEDRRLAKEILNVDFF